MIDGTVISQSTYVVNPVVAQSDLNIHNHPMPVIAAICHVAYIIIRYVGSGSVAGASVELDVSDDLCPDMLVEAAHKLGAAHAEVGA